MVKIFLILIFSSVLSIETSAQSTMVLCDFEPTTSHSCIVDIPDEQYLQPFLISNSQGSWDTIWGKTIYPILTSGDFVHSQDVVFEVFEIISAYNGQEFTRDFRFIESKELLVDATATSCFSSFTLTQPGFYQFKAHLGGYFVAQDMIIADFPPGE